MNFITAKQALPDLLKYNSISWKTSDINSVHYLETLFNYKFT